MEFSHVTVLLNETVNMLDFSKDGIFADLTAGGGGHSALIANKMSENSRLFCFDKDEEAVAVCKKRFENDKRVTVIHSDFKKIKEKLSELGIYGIDGVIADLGVSSYQLDNAERGFSYMADAALDMRMDRNRDFSAYDVVNGYSEEELADIFFKYGEERFSRRIAGNICEKRKEKPIETTAELVSVIRSAMPKAAQNEKQHPAKRCFQAIRIEVNGELESLDEGLKAMFEILNPGKTMAVITFHSLEDRAVKQFFQDKAKGCTCPKDFPVCVCNKKPELEIITRKPVLPTDEEIEINPRSRSAKLRAAKKL